MGKSVYSVVLSDEVIRLVDNVALKSGKSRSTMINEILADYVGVSTSKQRVDEILAVVTEAFVPHQRMRVLKRQESTIDFLSALDYRYNPRVTYSVEFFTGGESTCRLKIAMRTTNIELISLLNEFFADYIKLETHYSGKDNFSVIDGKLYRTLDFKDYKTSTEIALKISEYVNNIDTLINHYVQDCLIEKQKENLISRYLKIKDSIDF